jgi:hypothetical protein
MEKGMGEIYNTQGKMRQAHKILSENLKGRDHLGDLSVNWRILLKWILEKLGWECQLDLTGSGQG